MKVQYNLTVEDFAALQRFGESQQPSSGFRSRLWACIAIGVIACCVVAMANSDGMAIQWDSLGIYVVLSFWAVLVYLVVATWWSKRTFPRTAYAAANQRQMTENLLLELLPEGLKHSTHFSTNTLSWSVVKRIDETAEHLFFLLDDNSGFVIPRRAFAAETDYKSFAETARRYQAENRSTSGEG
jgi:YcxB-like protein